MDNDFFITIEDHLGDVTGMIGTNQCKRLAAVETPAKKKREDK